MMTNARAAYMDASVATADPVRLLVMLCDRLVLDVQRGLSAQQAGDRQEAHTQLVHAQAIVFELRASLRTDGFEGGEQLAAVYDHLDQQLVTANIRQDQESTRHCLVLVQQIADTWREAALQLAQPNTSPANSPTTAKTA
jgi:flagellar protein FliS